MAGPRTKHIRVNRRDGGDHPVVVKVESKIKNIREWVCPATYGAESTEGFTIQNTGWRQLCSFLKEKQRINE
jgi:hypothetical protein